jgi:hypothetical protein
MNTSGRCLCGAIEFEVAGDPRVVAVCHCRDCQRGAGAPMVVWAMFQEPQLRLKKGMPASINSSGTAVRSFCPTCGTGLFYRNSEVLPGLVDVQASAFDEPELLPPTIQIQVAERQHWVASLDALKAYERYP